MLRPSLAFLIVLFAITGSSVYSQNGAAGRGAVSDERNYGDRITLTMIGVPAIPRDKVYEAWLVTDNGIEQTSLGNLKVEADGTVKHAVTRDENFTARYNKLRVSLEPKDKLDPKQAGETVFQGEVPLPVMVSLRTLLVHFPGTPGGTALTIGLRTQSSLMLKHINLASAAASTGDLSKVKENAEAIVNIVEGAKGSNFGDLNNDLATQNPGDGYGLLGYAEMVGQRAHLLLDAEGSTPEMKQGAKNVRIAAANVGVWAGGIRDNALLLLQAGNVDAARPLLEQMTKPGMSALNGVDANENGLVEPVEGEAGAIGAYVYAQGIGTYEVKWAKETVVEKPAAAPDWGEQKSDPNAEPGEAASVDGAAALFILLGLLIGTSAVGFLAFLWAKSKTGVTRR